MTKHDEEEFAAPVLHGRRFQTHALPLDVLKELEIYQRLIVEVARALFLGRHADRQRAPKGFEARLRLSLRTVEPGSAMPVLLREVDRPASGQTSLMPPGPDEFDEARDLITEAVSAASNGTALPKSFPRSVLGRFNTFGRSLQIDEAIELRRRRSEAGPKYTHTLRKKLVLMEEKSFSDAVDVTGSVREADVDRGMFHVVVDGAKIPGDFRPEHRDNIIQALKEHERVHVRLVGVGRFDAQERLERIEVLDDVFLVEACGLAVANLNDRIAELGALERGWLDGESGELLDPVGLKKTAQLLVELHEQDDLPIPYLYPTPEGNLQAEWTLGAWEISATIELATGDADLDAVDTETGAGKEETASIYTSDGRAALAAFVTSFSRRGRP